ncbi:hypothetical protein H6A66_10210 [Bacteroides caecigallinarum]|uniref:hypothetical protein n=1 Tax=Bacteroides caecigallinarum TaxID=1411144 RepID=UPI00195D4E6C|nr:hypothetical protein [Bacteroides caecigallinarum]MBM6865535.1 hypothetical protein [Bacteroides caecigallinarum]
MFRKKIQDWFNANDNDNNTIIDNENMEKHEEKVTDDEVLSETLVDDELNEEKVSFNEDESNSIVKSKSDEELETLPLFSIHEMLKELLDGQNKLMKSQQILNSNLNSLREGLLKVTEKQEEIIKKQHNAALKFQEDVLYKIQKNLIMELIGIADNIQMLIEDKENNSDYDLLEAVKDLGKWVDASLRSNSVKRFIDVNQDNKVYNRKRQELVEKQFTENQEKDNTYRSLHPGYEWTLPYLVINSEVQLQRILDENHSPQMFTFVIRPEEVAKLVYKDKNKIEE